MSPNFLEKQSTRREMSRNSAGFAGSALLAQLFPASFFGGGFPNRRFRMILMHETSSQQTGCARSLS
jgi:hypothetical protein